MNVLETKNLYKEFDGVKAVDDLSFEIETNSIIGLVGPNGSGKTTLFNLITGFLKPDGGAVIFKNKEITSFPPNKIAQLGIGRTFQNIRLFPQISVMDNMMLALRYMKGESFYAGLLQLKSMKTEEKGNFIRAEELLELVGLSGKKHELAENLSHGQRKLMELVRIFALEPEVFLLDEPFAGVFPETRRTIIELARKLKGEGKAVVFIEHNINLVMEVAEKIIVLDYGKKIAEGKPEEIRKNKLVQKAYLGKTL